MVLHLEEYEQHFDKFPTNRINSVTLQITDAQWLYGHQDSPNAIIVRGNCKFTVGSGGECEPLLLSSTTFPLLPHDHEMELDFAMANPNHLRALLFTHHIPIRENSLLH